MRSEKGRGERETNKADEEHERVAEVVADGEKEERGKFGHGEFGGDGEEREHDVGDEKTDVDSDRAQEDTSRSSSFQCL